MHQSGRLELLTAAPVGAGPDTCVLCVPRLRNARRMTKKAFAGVSEILHGHHDCVAHTARTIRRLQSKAFLPVSESTPGLAVCDEPPSYTTVRLSNDEPLVFFEHSQNRKRRQGQDCYRRRGEAKHDCYGAARLSQGFAMTSIGFYNARWA